MIRRKIKCGDIYWLEEKNAAGHQYYKKRPHLIVDSDEYISVSKMVCVVPLTSKMSNFNKYDYKIIKNFSNNLKVDSLAKLDHIYTYDKERFIHCVGRIEHTLMKKIHFNLRKHFNL